MMSAEERMMEKRYTYGEYECIDVVSDITQDKDGFEGFCIGNILKYIWRYKYKNGAEDIGKAIDYCYKLKEHLECKK